MVDSSRRGCCPDDKTAISGSFVTLDSELTGVLPVSVVDCSLLVLFQFYDRIGETEKTVGINQVGLYQFVLYTFHCEDVNDVFVVVSNSDEIEIRRMCGRVRSNEKVLCSGKRKLMIGRLLVTN